MYTYEEVSAIAPITEIEYNANAYRAKRLIDNAVTGVDGINKLKIAFPTDEDDAEAVKHCFVDLLKAIVAVERNKDVSLYEGTTEGLRPKIIASVSSGSESISYATSVSNQYAEASKSADAEKKFYGDIIDSYLRGISDANGVSLLYMGAYPRR